MTITVAPATRQTLLYAFDDAEVFPLLESYTTARGPVTVRVECHVDDTLLRIAFRRRDDDPPAIAAVIALPLMAVDGQPEEFLLDVLGDASGCELFAEAGDARGRGFAYSFGSVDFSGWRTCRTDVQSPSELWGEHEGNGTRRIVPPVQLYRLRVEVGRSSEAVDVGLGALRITGNVRLAPPGIATDSRH